VTARATSRELSNNKMQQTKPAQAMELRS